MAYVVTNEGTGATVTIEASDAHDAANSAAVQFGAVYAQPHTKRANVFVLYDKIESSHGTYAKGGSVTVRDSN